MGFSDWLLALHLLSAFALVAALVLFTAVMVADWGEVSPQRAAAYFQVARVGGPLIAAGTALTLILGIWLAIDLKAYQPWDGWVIAAIVLWAIAGYTGSKVGAHYTQAQKLVEQLAGQGDAPSTELATTLSDRRIRTLHAITIIATVAILVDMIWKPGT